MIIYLKGIGVAAPGFENWGALERFLAGTSTSRTDSLPRPLGGILPSVERRRSSFTVKLAVDVAMEAVTHSGMEPGSMALVFASSNGDTDTIHHICEALATPERSVSPTRFHNSVHNAPAGYWSIATGSMQPSSSISAWNDSFAAGLVEAAVQCLSEKTPVLLAAYDSPFPAPLNEVTPGKQAFGVALVLDSEAQGSIAELDIQVDYDRQHQTTRMTNPDIEALRLDSSASRSLPLLEALAATVHREVVLSYAGDLNLRVVAKRLS